MSAGENDAFEDLMRFAKGIVQTAGEKALEDYGRGRPSMKFDEDLITKTELNLSEYFADELNRRFPEHQQFSNHHETDTYTHAASRYLWIFDPIDGVANYQAGIPIWGTSLALLENFWPVAGVFYMPATGDLFYAHAGGRAFWADREIHASPQETINDESLLLTYSRFHQRFRSTFPGKIRNLGCTAAHICYVATGRAEAAVLAHVSFQELAAGRIILEAAGAKLFRMDGSEFFLNEYLDGRQIDGHLIAVAPHAFDQMRAFFQEAV